jgi:hypothetical protein
MEVEFSFMLQPLYTKKVHSKVMKVLAPTELV